MKTSIYVVLTFLAIGMLVSSCNQTEFKAYNEGINITPTPMEMTVGEGTFDLSAKTIFVTADEEADKVAAYFASVIKNSTGFDLKISKEKATSNYIHLQLDSNVPVNDEGYLLDITSQEINIQARTAKGLFYGMQSVLQLLPAEITSPTRIKNIAWTIPVVNIKDEPRFKYRGSHLDVCRHFADMDFLKKHLDMLAMFKINTFHWHLTEDQGWRIEIKKYPKLTEMGAMRIEGEGNTYGPYFYTQEEVKEIVAYAKERFIEVIPEIELPGHAVAAINAYPELSCTGEEIPVRCYWGIANDVFCAGDENTFHFLEDVLTEVIPLFESDYFHIGGDECPKIRWKVCPKCQARIKELGLKTDKEHSAEERLQSYFVQRIEKFLLTHNKKMIGWDEILEGGLAPTATVMSWRGEAGGIAAANMGHDVIMTPAGWLYLDRYQGDSKLSPVTIGGVATLEKTYGYEPVPDQIDEDKKHHILGAQGNMWNEYNYTTEDMEFDMYPRLIALAELTWTPKEKKDYKDFERRLENQRVRMDMRNINYYIPMPEQEGAPSCNFVAFVDSTTLKFKTTEPVTLVYTINGKEPNAKSTLYTEPLTFKENTTLKIRSIMLSGKMSNTRTITLEKQSYAPATEKQEGDTLGLKAEYYFGNVLKVADLDGKTPDETEYVPAPQYSKHRVRSYGEVYENDYVSTLLTGYIHIPEDGVYYFNTDYEFYVDGKLLISNEEDNNGTARRFSRSDKSIALAKGYHSFKLLRLGAIFGGWPTQWDPMVMYMREAGEAKFRIMRPEDFE